MNVTIRMSGEADTVDIDGHTFDRSTMTRRERGTMAMMVRDGLIRTGKIKDNRRRTRRERRTG